MKIQANFGHLPVDRLLVGLANGFDRALKAVLFDLRIGEVELDLRRNPDVQVPFNVHAEDGYAARYDFISPSIPLRVGFTV